MNKISNGELEKVKGGANVVLVGVAIAAIVVFISGVIEGFTNPGRCSE